VQALEEIPRDRAEWIMWLDMDLLINKMDFTLPLENYEGKDIVLHGKPEYILQGEAKWGVLVLSHLALGSCSVEDITCSCSSYMYCAPTSSGAGGLQRCVAVARE
jgi:hypothetical protein